MDHQDYLMQVAAEIANDIIKGKPVSYGPKDYEKYLMADVEEFISCDSELCEARRQLLVRHMLGCVQPEEDAAENDLLAAADTKLIEFTFDVVGQFAESVAQRVANYRQDLQDEMLAQSMVDGSYSANKFK